MTAHTPPTTHEEIDFLDEIERELVALTTANLEGVQHVEPVASLPISTTLQTVRFANGEHDGLKGDG